MNIIILWLLTAFCYCNCLKEASHGISLYWQSVFEIMPLFLERWKMFEVSAGPLTFWNASYVFFKSIIGRGEGYQENAVCLGKFWEEEVETVAKAGGRWAGLKSGTQKKFGSWVKRTRGRKMVVRRRQRCPAVAPRCWHPWEEGAVMRGNGVQWLQRSSGKKCCETSGVCLALNDVY